jgi:hypothetical protein
MGFFQRFLRPGNAGREVREWQEAWTKAVANPDRQVVSQLRERLERLTAPDGDLEIEREMLDALEHMVEFAAAVAEQGLPAIATGHRVVGTDVCHFSAPVSMPDDPAQPSGRLLLTSTRVIFVGGSRSLSAAWHAITQPTQSHRDLILIRADGTALYRFRCNSFADAIRGAFIARRLAVKKTTRL